MEQTVPQPPAPATEQAPQAAVLPAAVAEQPPKGPPPAALAEQAPKSSPLALSAASQEPVTVVQPAGEGPPEIPTALIGSLTRASTGSGPGAGAAARCAGSGAPGSAAAPLSQGLGCGLFSLGPPVPGNLAGSWLDSPHLLTGSPMGLATPASSLAGAPTAVSSVHGAHGGSAVGSPPASPPGSGPGGSSGSASGAPGLALSGFLTLAGLLLCGGPRAMRRLRLLCEPWLTAYFVLVPERPG
jgi:hypothetical protein